MNRFSSLHVFLAFAGLSLILTGCDLFGNDEDSSRFVSKDGPRSLSKGIYRNTELGYSFAHPKTWYGGLFKAGDAVGYWSPDTGFAYITVYECHLDSTNICDFFLESDSAYGVPGAQTRHDVKVIVNFDADTTSTRISVLQRIHFQRGNKTVMLWLYGSPADFAAGSDFKRIDSSLTFF
jgi:hypothetical protein